MHNKAIRMVLFLVILALGVPACQLPFVSTPTPFVLPTPDMTVAVLFTPPPVLTPTPPEVVTETPPPSASPTVTASATAIPPTLTASPPPATLTATPARTGGEFEAAYLATPPTLDGVWDEWNTRAYPARSVVFGRGDWDGPEDLEASFRVGWDESYLYLAVKVIDDTYVQEAAGEELFKGDSLELLLDVDLAADFASLQLSGDDYQLGISPGRFSVGGQREAYLWFPAGIAGGRDQVRIGAASSPGVYRVEAAVPWSLFGLTPAAGQRYGFALSASDNDTPGETTQQTMVSSAERRDLGDPTTWGALTLVR